HPAGIGPVEPAGRRRGARAPESARLRAVASDALVRVEELLVLLEREAVRHPGDVVGDDARHGLALVGGTPGDVWRKLSRLLHVDLEERAHDAVGLLGHAGHAMMMVEPVVEEALQRLMAYAHLGRELDQPRLHATDG